MKTLTTNQPIEFKQGRDKKNSTVIIDGGEIKLQHLDCEMTMTEKKWIEYMTKERGHLVIKKRELISKLEA